MTTVELAEKFKDGSNESSRDHFEVAHWFYGMPAAGVKYYTYPDRATAVERTSCRKSMFLREVTFRT